MQRVTGVFASGMGVLLLVLAGVTIAGEQAGNAAPARPAGKTATVYFGTYSDTTENGLESKGIYKSTLDMETGALGAPELAVETVNPSFLAIHPNQKFLYSVGEIGEFKGAKTGAVNAYAIGPSQQLQLLNQEGSGGTGPCHLVVDSAGKYVLVANYGGGSVAALPIGDDGKLGEATAVVQHKGSSVNPQRQKEPHAHSINLDAANEFAFAADLGLDKVLSYKFDKGAGTLLPQEPAAKVSAGAGPRHFAFHPSGQAAYVINELANTITVFAYDSRKGALDEIQTIATLPADFKEPSYTAEVVVHPSGKFVYGSNRGHDSLAVFTVDEATGKLTVAGHVKTGGKTPRNFAIAPGGKFLLAANQGSSNVQVFAIDPKTGALEPAGKPTVVPMPVCVRFLPMGGTK